MAFISGMTGLPAHQLRFLMNDSINILIRLFIPDADSVNKEIDWMLGYASASKEMSPLPAGKIYYPLPQHEIYVGRCCVCTLI